MICPNSPVYVKLSNSSKINLQNAKIVPTACNSTNVKVRLSTLQTRLNMAESSQIDPRSSSNGAVGPEMGASSGRDASDHVIQAVTPTRTHLWTSSSIPTACRSIGKYRGSLRRLRLGPVCLVSCSFLGSVLRPTPPLAIPHPCRDLQLHSSGLQKPWRASTGPQEVLTRSSKLAIILRPWLHPHSLTPACLPIPILEHVGDKDERRPNNRGKTAPETVSMAVSKVKRAQRPFRADSPG